MNVTLSPELERFVKAAVESGRYESANEVVAAALRLIEEQGGTPSSESLHPQVDDSLAALTRGEGEQGEAYIETPQGELEESQEDERAVRP